MKKLSKDSASQDFIDYFNEVIEKKLSIVIWQFDKELSRRKAHRFFIEENKDDQTLLFSCEKGFSFSDGNVYGYIEALQGIFKSEILNKSDKTLSLHYPKEVALLDKKFFEVIKGALSDLEPPEVLGPTDQEIFEAELADFISPDEEDKMYQDKRAAPRAKPKKMKMVTAALSSTGEAKIYELYDLSKGGMSFLCLDEGHFKKGDEVSIYAIDEKSFQSPMISEVMSVRSFDELGVQFKVGLKFIG